MVKLFLAQGSDPNEKDLNGKGSLHKAMFSGNMNIVSLLNEHGVKL
jgi:ankyrin repeat protein